MANEFYLVPKSLEETGDNEETTLLQEEEEEEALSLCDLPLSNNIIRISYRPDHEDAIANNNNSLSRVDDDDDNDFFEFFSEEFTASTTHHSRLSENIIFCGKLIPFNQDDVVPVASKNNQRSSSSSSPSPSNSLHRYNNKVVARVPPRATTTSKGDFTPPRFEYSSVGKVSLMRSTTKSRWFLFMFGMTRLSNTEMELTDIRSRQSRSRSRRGPPSAAAEEVEMEGKRRKESKGVWRVLRSISLGLGCRSTKLANDVVKPTFV